MRNKGFRKSSIFPSISFPYYFRIFMDGGCSPKIPRDKASKKKKKTIIFQKTVSSTKYSPKTSKKSREKNLKWNLPPKKHTM